MTNTNQIGDKMNLQDYQTLQEYQSRILKLDSDIANLEAEKSQLLNRGREIFFPKYSKGTLVKFMKHSVKYGIIQFSHLDSRNPFGVKINVKPCKKDGSPIKRVVLHCINITELDILDILN